MTTFGDIQHPHPLIEQNATAMFVTTLDSTIKYINPAFTGLSGYTTDEAVGRKIGILSSGETPKEVYQELWRTILSGRVWRGELHNRRKDGRLYWEAITITPLKNSRREIYEFLATVEDVTARKTLEAERDALMHKLREALEHIEGLHGLLPICAHCKSIRSTDGAWHSLERYLREHSSTRLSHGICPECAAIHYPGIRINS